MDTGDLDVGCLHDDPLPLRTAADDVLAPQEHAVVQLCLTAEAAAAAYGAPRLLRRDGVVGVEHGNVAGGLVAENVLLGRYVLCHVLVHVQVIGGQIGHHRDMGTAVHGHQLEAGQLQHRIVLGPHTVGIAQQRVSDIAAYPHCVPCRLQQLGDDGGGRRLTVGAGDGDDGTRADTEELLHLAGQHAAIGHRRRKLGHIGPQARSAEDHVLVEPLQIIRSQPQGASRLFQLIGQCAQLLLRPLVAGSDADTAAQQQLHQRRVADADAQHCHRFLPQALHILMQGHVISLRLTVAQYRHYTALGTIVQPKNAPCRVRFFRHFFR